MNRFSGYTDVDLALMAFLKSLNPDVNEKDKELLQQPVSSSKKRVDASVNMLSAGKISPSILDNALLKTYETQRYPSLSHLLRHQPESSVVQQQGENFWAESQSAGVDDPFNTFEEASQAYRATLQKRAADVDVEVDPAQEKLDSSRVGWQPKYDVGTRVVNKTTRKEGIIVDISLPTQLYIIQYDGSSVPQFAKEDEIAHVEEFYISLEEKVEEAKQGNPYIRKEDTGEMQEAVSSQLQEALFGGESASQEQRDKNSAMEVMQEILLDPSVAPLVIKKLLEKGVIDKEQALSLLVKSGAVPRPQRHKVNARRGLKRRKKVTMEVSK